MGTPLHRPQQPPPQDGNERLRNTEVGVLLRAAQKWDYMTSGFESIALHDHTFSQTNVAAAARICVDGSLYKVFALN